MQVNIQASPVIVARRKAAAVLNDLCMHVLGMGTMAEKFHGDRDEDWAVIDISEIKALKHGELVAILELTREHALVSIPEPERLANRAHRYEFNPKDFGFMPRKMNWRKEMEPYLLTISIPENIPGLMAPVQPIRKAAVVGPPRAKRSL
jgi:hypothetical protein